MKNIILFLFILGLYNLSFGQKKVQPLPFIIQGQITNCPEDYLRIFFKDKNETITIDTLHLDKTGHFYLRTNKVIKPQRTSIQQKNIQINDIFVAPGYNLTITGNGQNFMSLYKSKKITGIGSESNRYRVMLDSILSARNDKTSWYEMNEPDLLAFIKKDQKLKDSLVHVVFDKKPVRDPYLSYFGKMTRYDNQFNKLYLLMAHVDMNKYDYDKSVAIVRNNFDNKVLDNLFLDEYFISTDYQTWVGGEYLNYLINLNMLKDPKVKKDLPYKLEILNKVYKGKLREYGLYHLMDAAIYQCKSFENTNRYKELFKPYLAGFKNLGYKNLIKTQFAEKEVELLRTQIGKPAPKFTLESNLNKTYSLDDFKGKVLYIDLWASWCGSCRAEIPDFKKLVNKFKDNHQIAFLSIAVNDGVNEWKKALSEYKPDWIQLLDREGVVWKSYVANTIPKYILIDKQGNIVNFDAPQPESGEKIEKLLLSEIAK